MSRFDTTPALLSGMQQGNQLLRMMMQRQQYADQLAEQNARRDYWFQQASQMGKFSSVDPMTGAETSNLDAADRFGALSPDDMASEVRATRRLHEMGAQEERHQALLEHNRQISTQFIAQVGSELGPEYAEPLKYELAISEDGTLSNPTIRGYMPLIPGQAPVSRQSSGGGGFSMPSGETEAKVIGEDIKVLDEQIKLVSRELQALERDTENHPYYGPRVRDQAGVKELSQELVNLQRTRRLMVERQSEARKTGIYERAGVSPRSDGASPIVPSGNEGGPAGNETGPSTHKSGPKSGQTGLSIHENGGSGNTRVITPDDPGYSRGHGSLGLVQVELAGGQRVAIQPERLTKMRDDIVRQMLRSGQDTPREAVEVALLAAIEQEYGGGTP